MEGTDLNGSDEEAYYDSIGVECIIDIDHGKGREIVISSEQVCCQILVFKYFPFGCNKVSLRLPWQTVAGGATVS